MTEERAKELQKLCLRFRNEIVDLLHDIQTGHPGGSLSCTEIVTTLYYEKMNIDPKNPNMEGRDHFILSKGHAAPILYIVLAQASMAHMEKEIQEITGCPTLSSPALCIAQVDAVLKEM